MENDGRVLASGVGVVHPFGNGPDYSGCSLVEEIRMSDGLRVPMGDFLKIRDAEVEAHRREIDRLREENQKLRDRITHLETQMTGLVKKNSAPLIPKSFSPVGSL